MKKTHLVIALLLGSTLFIPIFSQYADAESATGGRQMPFFMPRQEQAPRYEVLPPIPGTSRPMPSVEQTTPIPAANSYPLKRARRYVAVDGRFIPLEDEEETNNDAKSELAEDVADSSEEAVVATTDAPEAEIAEPLVVPTDTPTPKAQPMPKVRQSLEQTDSPKHMRAPTPSPKPKASQTFSEKSQVDPKADKRPKYQRRYDEYMESLEEFKRTKKLPANADLEAALAQRNSDDEIVIFDDVVKRR